MLIKHEDVSTLVTVGDIRAWSVTLVSLIKSSDLVVEKMAT